MMSFLPSRWALLCWALVLSVAFTSSAAGVRSKVAFGNSKGTQVPTRRIVEPPGGQSMLFQGLWTDPIHGVTYARARWYDARNATWLSEDPAGEADSPNLYAFVAWQPNMLTDPMGLKAEGDDRSTWQIIKDSVATGVGNGAEGLIGVLMEPEKIMRSVLEGTYALATNGDVILRKAVLSFADASPAKRWEMVGEFVGEAAFDLALTGGTGLLRSAAKRAAWAARAGKAAKLVAGGASDLTKQVLKNPPSFRKKPIGGGVAAAGRPMKPRRSRDRDSLTEGESSGDLDPG